MKIWEPKAPGTLWATSGLLRDPFTFLLRIEVTMEVECIYGMLVTIYQTMQCHNPVGHSVLYEIIWLWEFLGIAIDKPLYFFAIETLLI